MHWIQLRQEHDQWRTARLNFFFKLWEITDHLSCNQLVYEYFTPSSYFIKLFLISLLENYLYFENVTE